MENNKVDNPFNLQIDKDIKVTASYKSPIIELNITKFSSINADGKTIYQANEGFTITAGNKTDILNISLTAAFGGVSTDDPFSSPNEIPLFPNEDNIFEVREPDETDVNLYKNDIQPKIVEVGILLIMAYTVYNSDRTKSFKFSYSFGGVRNPASISISYVYYS